MDVQHSKTEASVKALAQQHNESHTEDQQEDTKLDITNDADTSAQILFNKTQTDDQMLLAVSNQTSVVGGTVLG